MLDHMVIRKVGPRLVHMFEDEARASGDLTAGVTVALIGVEVEDRSDEATAAVGVRAPVGVL